jgi:hypothetical protein
LFDYFFYPWLTMHLVMVESLLYVGRILQALAQKTLSSNASETTPWHTLGDIACAASPTRETTLII